MQDDPELSEYNVQNRVNEFVSAAQNQASYYTTDNIMFTMGSDFHYEDALEVYKNLDKLIHYVNTMVGWHVESYTHICILSQNMHTYVH